MARSIPTVQNEKLIWRAAGSDETIIVGSLAWFIWLEGATHFAYRGPAGSFTARKEQRLRGGWYWKAYRKLAGRLHRIYLGKTNDLTPERLAAAAATLAERAESGPRVAHDVSNDSIQGTLGSRPFRRLPVPFNLPPSERPPSSRCCTPRLLSAPSNRRLAGRVAQSHSCSPIL